MIKNICTAILLSVGFALTINAQSVKTTTQKIIVADTTQISYEEKLRPALSYEIDIDVKSLKKHWKKFLAKRFKETYKVREKNMLVTEDILVPSIFDKRVNLYAKVVEKTDTSVISFLGAFGYDIYIDADVYPKDFKTLKLLVEKFLLESATLYYAGEIQNFSKEIYMLNKKNLSLSKKNIEKNSLIKEGDDELITLNKIKKGDTDEAVSVLKKINKITKKQVAYKSDVVANKKEIAENELAIDDLKKQIDVKIAKTKLLKQ